jgi:hypothetical protein
MALIVEDGTGKADAESYASVTYFDAYWVAHGSPVDLVGIVTPAKESALRYGALDLDAEWDWNGAIANLAQALAWPRTNAWDNEGRLLAPDVVPVVIQYANCEKARLHLIGDGLNAVETAGLDALEVGPISLDFSGPITESQKLVRRLLLAIGVPRGIVPIGVRG